MATHDVTVKQQPGTAEESTRPGRSYVPNADIGETTDGLWLSVDLPGVDDKSVEVELHDGILSIEGRVDLGVYEDLKPLYTEYNVGHFERRFRIAANVDPNRIEAKIADGVLHLALPKPEAARPRTIEISGG